MMKRKRSKSKSGRELRSSSKPSSRRCIQIDDEEEEVIDNEKDTTPLRPIFCLKNIVDLERFDEIEDCYVLDFDPSHSLNRRLSFSKDVVIDSDLSLIAEKGQVACRDYPHARFLCIKFPFLTTPHQSCCEMCYCYVCDAVAPCKHWKQHCDASHNDGIWKMQRRLNQKNSKTGYPTSELAFLQLPF